MLINVQGMKLSRGHYFNPKDEDAIFFLNEKVSGRPLRPLPRRMILELDPYDPVQQRDIFKATDELGSLYFFTKLRRKGTNVGTNIDRKVGTKGNWHGGAKNTMIKDRRKSVIGMSRKLTYWEASGSRNHKRYIMTEYLLPSNGDYDIFKDWIFCRLVKNSRRKDGDESAENNSPCEEVEEGDEDQEVMDSPQMAYDELYDNPTAANSGDSPMAAHNPHIYEVEATLSNNLQLEYSTAVAITPLDQTLVAVNQHEDDNQAMTSDDTVNPINAPTCISPMAAHNPHTYEVEATYINNLPVLEYSTAVEDTPLDRALVAVNQHEGYNQAMTSDDTVNPINAATSWSMVTVNHNDAATSCSMALYDPYTCEVEAVPTINNLPGVEDGTDKYVKSLTSLDCDNYDNQLISVPTNAEQRYWTMYFNMKAMIKKKRTHFL